MDGNRWWILGAALTIAVVVLMGFTLGISPQAGNARAADREREAVEVQNEVHELQLAKLKEQFDSIGDLEAELSELRKAIPGGADYSAFVGQLDAIAAAHQVALSSIAVSDPQPYVPETPPAAADPAAAATDAAGAAAADGSAAAASGTPAPTASTGVTAENFVAVPISLSVEGGHDAVLNFIEGLQRGERLVMITSFNTTSGAAGAGSAEGATPAAADAVTATISALIYVLLAPDAVPPAPTG